MVEQSEYCYAPERGASTATELLPGVTYVIGHVDVAIEISGLNLVKVV